ncbi:hypothetical protein EV356DRAFT_506615 [Viridothelium virens]|uniref:60S ribosomal protein L20 n=1 Tax=Viridothelium virens TaxID=1048519 RepID=A0A6A6H236_VIRVR|nr:hypothetical protein EV356DRAFT_506615 [Viridothelium virens]
MTCPFSPLSLARQPFFKSSGFSSRTCRRQESTARRLRQRLRIKPEPSFAETIPTQDHIIYNPPSSAPSVYHTPFKFLPQNDKRRQRLAAATTSSPFAFSAPTSDNSTSSTLPPPLRAPVQKRYHLTSADFDEIRRLRIEDPLKWSNIALAKKFQCSTVLIPMICSVPKEVKQIREKELEDIKQKWGPKKRAAREDRARRRERWGRDE